MTRWAAIRQYGFALLAMGGLGIVPQPEKLDAFGASASAAHISR
jgi:hypothetical protein